MFRVIIAFYLWLNFIMANAQNYFKTGATYDFEKESFFQTLAIDLNRTEKVDEKTNSVYFFYSSNDRYILPSIDVNVGQGVTSSENNLLTQLVFGQAWLGNVRVTPGNLRRFVWNGFAEVNPSYNSDRDLNERLGYGQIKLGAELVRSRHNMAGVGSFVRDAQSFHTGLLINVGYRYSDKYHLDRFYNTFGIFIDWKARFLSSATSEDFVFKISGTYYYIASDIHVLAIEQFAGIIKPSVDIRLVQTWYLNIGYKFGNDNPTYKYVNALDVSVKYKY